MPGKPSSSRSRTTGGVMTPRSSAMIGQVDPSARPRRVERRASRAADPAPRARVGGAARDRPVGDEAAEVVDAREVEEVERAPEALDPPAVAAAAQRRPVVDRVAPELALRGEVVRRRAGDDVVAEQLRMGDVVGAAGRDVDRHVADQPHAAVGGVRAQSRPFAVEADLVVDRARPAGERRPVVDPGGVLGPERVGLVAAHRRRRGRRAAPARPRKPSELCTVTAPDRADPAEAPATTPAPQPRASRRIDRPAVQAGRPAARSGAAARRWIA